MERIDPPVLLGLSGLAGAEFIPQIVTLLSNGQIASEGSMTSAVADSLTFKQPMLWDRLWPNPTYSPGILLGFIWVGGPLLLFLIWLTVKRFWKPNWMQAAAIGVIVGGFSVIGLIISAKIGRKQSAQPGSTMADIGTINCPGVPRWLDRGLPGLYEVKSLLVIFCLTVVFPTTS